VNFLDRFSKEKKNSKIKLKENPPVEAEFVHADGQTDMTKPTVALHNFANAPKTAMQQRLTFR
jgi:hypothetical protein